MKLYLKKEGETNYILLLTITFLVISIIKSLMALPYEGPQFLGDEWIYQNISKYFFSSSNYYFHHTPDAPPLYPLIIMPSFILGDHFYTAAKIINVIISSLIVVPVWKMSRLYLDEKTSFYITVISLLQPYHFVYPKYVMTENLYYPLFLITIYYLILTINESRLKKAVILAILIALNILTKYTSIIMLPFIFMLFFLPPKDFTGSYFKLYKMKLIQAVVIVLVFVTILLPFILMTEYGPSPFLNFLTGFGKGYASSPVSKKIDVVTGLFYFFKFCLLYVFYSILAIAPFLTLILLTKIKITKQFFRDDINRYILVISAFTIAFLAISIRHSYNPESSYWSLLYLIGRYSIHLPMLWIILAFINFKRLLNNDIASPKKAVALFMFSIMSLFLVIISYKGLIDFSLWDFIGKWRLPSWFITQHNGLDAYKYLNNHIIFFLTCSIILITGYLIKYMKSRAMFLFFLLICVFYVLSAYIHIRWATDIEMPSKNIPSFYSQIVQNDKKLYVFNGTNVSNMFTYMNIDFFVGNQAKIEILKIYHPYMFKNQGICIADSRNLEIFVKHRSNLIEEYSTVKIKLFRTPFDSNVSKHSIFFGARESKSLKIERYGPQAIDIAQNDSLYNIWVIPSEMSEDLKIVIDGIFLSNHEYGGEFITGAIPQEIFTFLRKDRYELRIFDINRMIYSEPVIIYTDEMKTNNFLFQNLVKNSSFGINSYGPAEIKLSRETEKVIRMWFKPDKKISELKVIAYIETNNTSLPGNENLRQFNLINIKNVVANKISRKLSSGYHLINYFEPENRLRIDKLQDFSKILNSVNLAVQPEYFGNWIDTGNGFHPPVYLNGFILNTVQGDDVVTTELPLSLLMRASGKTIFLRLADIYSNTISEPVRLNINK